MIIMIISPWHSGLSCHDPSVLQTRLPVNNVSFPSNPSSHVTLYAVPVGLATLGSTFPLSTDKLAAKHVFAEKRQHFVLGRTPLINAQCPSMPINANQNSCIGPNVDQFRSIGRHFGSMPWIWLALIGIGHWSRESCMGVLYLHCKLFNHFFLLF